MPAMAAALCAAAAAVASASARAAAALRALSFLSLSLRAAFSTWRRCTSRFHSALVIPGGRSFTGAGFLLGAGLGAMASPSAGERRGATYFLGGMGGAICGVGEMAGMGGDAGGRGRWGVKNGGKGNIWKGKGRQRGHSH